MRGCSSHGGALMRFRGESLISLEVGEEVRVTNIELLGIGLTVFFGVIALVVGVRAVKKRSQNQSVKGGGAAVQSGRDTNIKS